MSGVCKDDGQVAPLPGRVLPDDKPSSVMVVLKTWFCKHEVVLPDGSGRTQLVSMPPGATAGSIVTVGFPVLAERAPDADEPDHDDAATP